MNTPRYANPFTFVTGKRRMLRSGKTNILDKTYFAISELDVDEEIKATYRQTAEKYFNECGCSLGSFFLVVTLGFSIFQWLFVGGLATFLLVIPATIFGKFLGIGVGRIKLFVLFKKLSTDNSVRSPNLSSKKDQGETYG
jgi:hypothetical protein